MHVNLQEDKKKESQDFWEKKARNIGGERNLCNLSCEGLALYVGFLLRLDRLLERSVGSGWSPLLVTAGTAIKYYHMRGRQ